MNKYLVYEGDMISSADGTREGCEYVYLASEVDARIAELEKALREISDYIDSAGNGIGVEVRIAEIVNTVL